MAVNKAKYTRYYMGEAENPYEHASDLGGIWLVERRWATDTVDHLIEDTNYTSYCKVGLVDFEQEDTTPVPLKAALWHIFDNRHGKDYWYPHDEEKFPDWRVWSHDIDLKTAEGFKTWYKEVYMAGGTPPRRGRREWHPMTKADQDRYWENRMNNYSTAYQIGAFISTIITGLLLLALLK